MTQLVLACSETCSSEDNTEILNKRHHTRGSAAWQHCCQAPSSWPLAGLQNWLPACSWPVANARWSALAQMPFMLAYRWHLPGGLSFRFLLACCRPALPLLRARGSLCAWLLGCSCSLWGTASSERQRFQPSVSQGLSKSIPHSQTQCQRSWC